VEAADAVFHENGELLHGIGGDEDVGIGHGGGRDRETLAETGQLVR
jgi:hypothetical protein